MATGLVLGSGSGGDHERHGILSRGLDLDTRFRVRPASVEVALAVTNRWNEHVEFDLSWELAADFAAMSEAMGGDRQQEARVSAEPMENGVRFRYLHPDLPLETRVVAVGGGGLIAGTATACRDSDVRVVGVEPRGIPTLHSALAAGGPVDVEVDSLTASALGARRTGEMNFAIARDCVDAVYLVDDDEILAARDLLWNEVRLAVEPAGAAGVAAVLSGQVDAEQPCVVLCGANSSWLPLE
ncbi:MAG: pyridoxal-phosphate dependent enzyme [Actinobacteria bacterium]|nr:pyridoxal-phosphate dependent enzyme [Actinomycetota bacterium]